MIGPEQAWAAILDQVRPLEIVEAPLGKAAGFYLAEAVRADRDLPPADRSSVDGYAVRSADLRGAACLLRVKGEAAAGSGARPCVRTGTCVRIFTGANVPPGADRIIKVEDAVERDGVVSISLPAEDARNILRRGEDARKGAVLVRPGASLDAMRIGVLAAVGKSRVRVRRRPRVAILCTGSELRRVQDTVAAHMIRNSNGPALQAALERWGFPGSRFRVVADRLATLVRALERALESNDVILVTGGVSAGKYDFVPEAAKGAGAKLRFHRVAMRPGKPTLYAAFSGNRHLFGLPGNPLSALTSFHEFALPAIRRLAGCPSGECRPGWPLPLRAPVAREPGFRRCALARIVQSGGVLQASPVPFRSSADLAAAALADGVVLAPPGAGELEAGTVVTFRAWRPLP